MAMSNPSSKNLPLTNFKLLHEAIEIPTKNWRLFLSILHLTLISFSLLFLTNSHFIPSLLLKLSVDLDVMHTAEPGSSKHSEFVFAVKENLKILAYIEFTFMVVSFVVSSFLQMATVHASAVTYFSRHLSVEELVARLRKSWKATLVTQLYVAILSLCCVLMLLVLFGFFVLVDNGSIILIAFGAIVAPVVTYMYVNLVTECSMGVVVSVVEEDCYGIEALGRAMELIKGRRRQGFVITLLLMASSCAYYWAYTFSTAYVPPLMANPLANGFVMVNASVLLNSFVLVMYTVFYYECRSHGEEVTVVKGATLYSSLPITNTRNFDTAFP